MRSFPLNKGQTAKKNQQLWLKVDKNGEQKKLKYSTEAQYNTEGKNKS